MIKKYNKFEERIQEGKVDYSINQWEYSCRKLYDNIKNAEDLIAFCNSDDVNTAIFSINVLVPNVFDALRKSEKRKLREILERRLSDERMCEINPTPPMFEEEDSRTIAGVSKGILDNFY